MDRDAEVNAEEFAVALGVKVVMVPDLEGECAIYDPDRDVMEVCAQLCWRRRAQAFDELLPVLGWTDL